MSDAPRLSIERVQSCAQRFPAVNVTVLGDVMLDRYFWGDVDRISPEAPVPVVRVTRRSARLGGAANVAANLAALGVRVSVVGVVGEDREGGEVRRLLEDCGIAIQGLVAVPGRATTEKVRIIARNQQVVRADFEADEELPSEVAERLFELARVASSQSDVLLVSDYGKGVVIEGPVREVIGAWRGSGKPVLVDPHVGHFPWYRGATVITPNVRQALQGASLPPGTKRITSADAFRIRAELELDALLITRGEDGMSLYTLNGDGTQGEVHVPAVARDVYDVTGAGDTVISVMAAGLGCGADLVEAVVMANRAAGEVVKEVGTSTITVDALVSAFKRMD